MLAFAVTNEMNNAFVIIWGIIVRYSHRLDSDGQLISYFFTDARKNVSALSSFDALVIAGDGAAFLGAARSRKTADPNNCGDVARDDRMRLCTWRGVQKRRRYVHVTTNVAAARTICAVR